MGPWPTHMNENLSLERRFSTELPIIREESIYRERIAGTAAISSVSTVMSSSCPKLHAASAI
jgi:hypothetical protein